MAVHLPLLRKRRPWPEIAFGTSRRPAPRTGGCHSDAPTAGTVGTAPTLQRPHRRSGCYNRSCPAEHMVSRGISRAAIQSHHNDHRGQARLIPCVCPSCGRSWVSSTFFLKVQARLAARLDPLPGHPARGRRPRTPGSKAARPVRASSRHERPSTLHSRGTTFTGPSHTRHEGSIKPQGPAVRSYSVRRYGSGDIVLIHVMELHRQAYLLSSVWCIVSDSSTVSASVSAAPVHPPSHQPPGA